MLSITWMISPMRCDEPAIAPIVPVTECTTSALRCDTALSSPVAVLARFGRLDLHAARLGADRHRGQRLLAIHQRRGARLPGLACTGLDLAQVRERRRHAVASRRYYLACPTS